MSDVIPSAEALIQHTGWLRALALQLVRDASQADDVVQRALLQALRRPPQDPRALPAWLARVARNEAGQMRRSDLSRKRREERSAGRLRTAQATDDVVARAEIHRRVVDVVLGLEEPYRAVVLLRYFDGMEPKAIAMHLGLPPGTVRSRLKRGLDRLRERLDDASGGDRRGWVLSLVALVDPKDLVKGGGPAAALGAGGALLVSTKAKIGVGISLLVLLVVGVVAWRASRASGDRREGMTAQHSPLAEPDDDGARLEGRVSEQDVSPDPEAPAANEPEGPAAPAMPRATLRFTDDAGREIEAAEVRRRYADAGLPLRAVLVSEDVLDPTDQLGAAVRRLAGIEEGRRTVEWGSGAEGLSVELELGTWRLFVARPGATPLVTETFTVDEGGEAATVEVTLPLAVPGLNFRFVEAESGVPLAGAVVVPYFEFGDDLAFFEGPPLAAGAGGELRLPRRETGLELGFPRGRACAWWVRAPGRLAQVTFWVAPSEVNAVHDVLVPRTATITGHAYGQDGQPAVGCMVVLARKGLALRTTVDEDGTYRLEGVPAHRASHDLFLLEDVAALRFGRARAEVRPGETSEVMIGEPADAYPRAAITGRITAGGAPWQGAVVFGRAPGQKGDDGSMTQADADGRYRLVVPAGAITIGVWLGGADDFMIRATAPLEVGVGEEHELDFDLPGGAVRVTVVDAASGEPVAGALAYTAPENREVAKHRFAGYSYQAGSAGSADAEGTVRLGAMVPAEPHELRVKAPGYEPFVQTDVRCSRAGEEPVEITVRLQRQ